MHSTDDVRFHQLERGVGKVERYIHIPADANTSLISSELKNGVLSVSIPKKESAKGRIKIPVSISR
jgi:HSP20 family molecular chaperone IbpA